MAVLIGAAAYLFYDFVDTGLARDFIIENSEESWAPPALYYLGHLFAIIQNNDRAEEIYGDYIENFGGEKHYRRALYRYYYIAARQRRGKEAFERGQRYIEEFPDSERVNIIERRLQMLRK